MERNSLLNNYTHDFSIIIPVYKVEPFLRECVDSVISQDHGIENIQIILVDDGSPDKSGEICDEYQRNYPNNVYVIHKENGGVSSARNIGVQCATGRYINCLDSDDKLSYDVLSKVFRFFMQHEDETDVVCVPRYYFEGRTDQHNLNYKFSSGSRVIDLEIEPTMILNTANSAFLTNRIAKQLSYNSQLKYSEDTLYICQALLEKKTLGVVSNCKYYSRKRMTGSLSATQQMETDVKNYLPPMEHLSVYMINYCNNRFGYVPKFIQFALMFELQWKLRNHSYPVSMTPFEINCWETKLQYVLSHIDDKIIWDQKHMNIALKNHCIRIKYPSLRKKYFDTSVKYYHNEDNRMSLSNTMCKLEFLDINDNSIRIEGCVHFPVPDETIDITVYVNGQAAQCATETKKSRHLSLGHDIWTYLEFCTEFTIDPFSKNEVEIKWKLDGHEFSFHKIVSEKYFPITKKLKHSYFYRNGIIVKFKENKICFASQNNWHAAICELKLLHEFLIKKNHVALKAFFAHILFHVFNLFKRRDLWLFTDRVNKADDNGQALYEYVKNKRINANMYFVLRKDSPDYSYISKLGKTVSPDSWKYKMLYLLSDMIISSHADDIVKHPFHEYSYYYQNLVHHHFIFLQHGIIKDDMSRWLNRRNMDLSVFVTAAVPEYNSILSGNYGYNESVVKLTGLPRFDKLYHTGEKIITIMPSWRSYLVGGFDGATGIRHLKPGFEECTFYKMYTELLNNSDLIEKCKEYGYQIQFFPHPNMTEAVKKFSFHPDVQILSIEKTYRSVFAESALIITDYSSAVFDFAYLRKPIIYYQADREEFFSGAHTYDKGYFNYDCDGFGEVTLTAKSTVDIILMYLENGCIMKDEFIKRRNSFFAYDDQNNSKRVLDVIIKLKSGKGS